MNFKMSQSDMFRVCLLFLSAAAITITGICFHQSFFRIFPLYVSLVISLLQSKVNRYSNLLGGINSVFYGFVYIYYHLYGSAMYAFLVSCPFQLITFIRWSRNSWGKSTVLKKLTVRQRIFAFIGFAVAWGVMIGILSATNEEYIILDCSVTMLGILISILVLFAYIEYTGIMIFSGCVNIFLYITMTLDKPEQITYLIYSLYSFICICAAFSHAKKIYLEQQISAAPVKQLQVSE